MILTNYYLLKVMSEEKSTGKKRETPRFDCVASTGDYAPFEKMAANSRTKSLYVYYKDAPNGFKTKCTKILAASKGHVSGVYVPDLNNPCVAFGDMDRTMDALLFLFSEDFKQLEIFVSRGNRDLQREIYRYYCTGDRELMGEISTMREQAQSCGAFCKC